jgi:hypothetical protein
MPEMTLLRAAEASRPRPGAPLSTLAALAEPPPAGAAMPDDDHRLRGLFPLIASLDLPGNGMLRDAWVTAAVRPPEAEVPARAPSRPLPTLLPAGEVKVPLREVFRLLGAAGAASAAGFAALAAPATARP